MVDNVVVDDDKQANLAFAEGFDEESPAEEVLAKTEVAPKVEAKQEPKIEPKVEAKAPVEEKSAVPAPKFVQITQEQFDSLLASAKKTEGIEAQLSKVFGTVGNMKQVVDRLQAATPAGMSIEIPKDAFAEMEKDFPELAKHTRDGLEKVLKNIKGTGPATGATIDPEAVQKVVNAAYARAETQRQVNALDRAHPTWREIVGAVDGHDKHDPNNPFRKWLAKQPAEYQHKINSTDFADDITDAINKFLAATKAPVQPAPKTAPKIAARKDRIQAAMQPKGDGGQPAPRNSADDDFKSGFQEETRRFVG